MPTQVRPFSRDDREQITTLINAHISAVVPNVSVSVPGLLCQIAREPGEFIVEPWVVERRTLVLRRPLPPICLGAPAALGPPSYRAGVATGVQAELATGPIRPSNGRSRRDR